MNDFKRNDRFGGKKAFGGKPPFQRPGGAGFNRPQLPMFPATCANCGKATEVPFRPDGKRPIYCRDCLGGNKPASASREFSKRDFQKPAFRSPASSPVVAQPQKPDTRIDEIQRQLAKVQVKLDQILVSIAVAKAQAGSEAGTVKKKKPSKKK